MFVQGSMAAVRMVQYIFHLWALLSYSWWYVSIDDTKTWQCYSALGWLGMGKSFWDNNGQEIDNVPNHEMENMKCSLPYFVFNLFKHCFQLMISFTYAIKCGLFKWYVASLFYCVYNVLRMNSKICISKCMSSAIALDLHYILVEFGL